MERVARDPRDGKALGFAFKPPERIGRVIFEVEDGELKIGSRVLLDDFEFWLERGEHVTLVGPNSYVGGWPEYVRMREERAELEREAKARGKAASNANGRKASKPAATAPSKNQERRAKALMRSVLSIGARDCLHTES
jgi:ATPase subunit of ABC transporter with duplicated ATPase domains